MFNYYFRLAITFSFATLATFPLAGYSQNIPQLRNAIVAQQKFGAITYSQLVIGGIRLEMSEAETRRILGKPLRVKTWDSPAIGKARTLEYRGLKVDLLEDARPGKRGKFYVYQVTSNSREFATLDRVRVGDSRQKVIQIYGKPARENNEGNIVSLIYSDDSKGFPAALVVIIKNGRVTEITCLLPVT